MSEQKVDIISQSSHQKLPITTTPPSRSVLADCSNRKCLQLKPDKTIVKQNESYIEQEGEIAPQDCVEIRPTTTPSSPGPETWEADKNLRPYQASADDNFVCRPGDGDAKSKLNFEGCLLTKGRSVKDIKVSRIKKFLWNSEVRVEEKENAGYTSEINDKILNKSLIKKRDQQLSGPCPNVSRQNRNHRSLYDVVPEAQKLISKDKTSTEKNKVRNRKGQTLSNSISNSFSRKTISLQASADSACFSKRNSKLPCNSINSDLVSSQTNSYVHARKRTDVSETGSIHVKATDRRPKNDSEIRHALLHANFEGRSRRINSPSKFLTSKNNHQCSKGCTKDSLLRHHLANNGENSDNIRVSCIRGNKTRLITSECRGKVDAGGMKNANLTNSLGMNGELVKDRTIGKITEKNFGTCKAERGATRSTNKQGVIVLNRNLKERRVPRDKPQSVRTISRTEKGSRIDNPHKRSPELPTSPEKEDGILNGGDKTSLTREEQFTDGDVQGQTGQSGLRKDDDHLYLNTLPRVINNERYYHTQNRRSSSEHRIGSYIYWERDIGVDPNIFVENSSYYDYDNEGRLLRNVDGVINCVGNPSLIHEYSLRPDEKNNVEIASRETCKHNIIQKPEDHVTDDLDTSQSCNSGINNKKAQILLCQIDNKIKGAQQSEENTEPTANETPCHGDLKGLPSGNITTKLDQCVLIGQRDNIEGGLPLISDFRGENALKEPRLNRGMNRQLVQTGKPQSPTVGNEQPSVLKHPTKNLFTDKSQSEKGITNTKTIADLNKIRRRKPVVLSQEENIKELYSNTKENKSEKRSTGNLACSNAQNRTKTTNHVTLHSKTSTSKGLKVNEQKKRDLTRTPPDLTKNRSDAGSSNASSTCKRPGCKHSTLIGYKSEQKCSTAKHSPSDQETLGSFTFSETANREEVLICNRSIPAGSPSTTRRTEPISKEPEKVGDNTCCEIITHAHCNAEDSPRQQESSADNKNSDTCLLPNEIYGSDLRKINVTINHREPICVPAVDINGLTSQSSPNEEIKQSGSALVEVTYKLEGSENECNSSVYQNDNRKSIMDPRTTNEMEIGCDSVSNDNNRGHERGADQTSTVPDHSQLHGSKDDYKTDTGECVSKQSNEQQRQASTPTIDNGNKHLDAKQRQHSSLKEVSTDNDAKGTETKDEKAINLKPGKANTTSLIKCKGRRLTDDEGSVTNGRSICTQKRNIQSVKSKLVNKQSKATVSGVPVPKHSKLPTAQNSSSQSKPCCNPKGAVSPSENNATLNKSENSSNSSRSSMERSFESTSESNGKSRDQSTPKSPKLRIYQTKTSRQRAKNASHATKDSPTDTKDMTMSDISMQEKHITGTKKSPTVTKKDVVKNFVRANSQSPRLGGTRKIKSASLSPVVPKRETTSKLSSPSMSRISPLSLNLPVRKSVRAACSRSSSASRSSKESTPDNSINLCSKSSTASRTTLPQKRQGKTDKKPVVTTVTSHRKPTNLPVKSTGQTSRNTSLHTKSQDSVEQKLSGGVNAQRNAILKRNMQTDSVIKSRKESPNLARKIDKTLSGYTSKSELNKQKSSVLKSEKRQEICAKHFIKDASDREVNTKTIKKIHPPVDSDSKTDKQGAQLLQRKSEITIGKSKITSPPVRRSTSIKSPSTDRKNGIYSSPVQLKNPSNAIPHQTTCVKTKLPKAYNDKKKLELKHDIQEKEKGVLFTKSNATSIKEKIDTDNQSQKAEDVTVKPRLTGAQSVSSKSLKGPTLKLKSSQSSVPKTNISSATRSGQKESDSQKTKTATKSSIPAPRTSTPIQNSPAQIPHTGKLSKPKTALKQNINPDLDIKIRRDKKQEGENNSSKIDKNKSKEKSKIDKAAHATSSYLPSKPKSIKEYERKSNENRCSLSMAEDVKSSISLNNRSQGCTTDTSQNSKDGIEKKKKCEETVSINSSNSVENSFGQKINEANKSRNVSTSSEEYWSASDDENLDNVSSRSNTHSCKKSCVVPSQASYQKLHPGIILESTLEKSCETNLKDVDENHFNKNCGNSLTLLGPHDYTTDTEATTVHGNQEMAMRLPAMKQLGESQQCNYHVQVADERETNLKINHKTGDNNPAIAKTMQQPGYDVHKDSSDLISPNITHPLIREEDRAVLNVNSERLCKKDKNQYVSTDIETKLSELTNLRDYFDERNDNSKLRINEGSQGASQSVQCKKSFGNDHSKNTMDNLSNLSYENCVSTQQGGKDGLYSSSDETSDQEFISEFSSLEQTPNSTDEVKTSDTFQEVASKCVESASDSGPHVEDYGLNFNSYKNAVNCAPGAKLSSSEPNPTNENSLNLSNGTRTELASTSSDTSNQEEFESFDSDSGESMMENGNCDIKFPTDDHTTTIYTGNNMEIQQGPTRRITRQRRIITRSERSVRYETVTAKISSPECVQETSEARAPELSVKANAIPQSSSCVITSSRDRQVTSYTVTSEVNGNSINEEKSLRDDRIINSSSCFRYGHSTSLHTLFREKEDENTACYNHKYIQPNTREVLTHSETTSETEPQNVFASFVLEDKTCYSPKYTSNRLSDVNIVLKLQQSDEPLVNSAVESNLTTDESHQEVNVTLNLNSVDENNVSTYVTKSSSCESANSEDINPSDLSTIDKTSDYSKSESTSFEIADVNEIQDTQSGIKPLDLSFVTENVYSGSNAEELSDNEHYTENSVQISDVRCDEKEGLFSNYDHPVRGTDNQKPINDEEISIIPETDPIESKTDLSASSDSNDINDKECNHVRDNANTHTTSVTDLGSSTIPGGMSSASQVKTTESVHTNANHSDNTQSKPADSVQDLKVFTNSTDTRVKNDMQTAVKKERDRQGIRRFTATVCLQDVQESQAENRNKFRSRSKSPIGLKNEDGVESKQGVSCAGISRVSEIRRTFLGKAGKINIPEPKIERNKPVSPSTQLTSRNSKWVNACGKWKRIPVDDDGNPLHGYLSPDTVCVSSGVLSKITEVPNENKAKTETKENEQEQRTVPFSDKRAMFEKRKKSKTPPKVLPKPSEAKRRMVVSCLQQWKGRVADRRSREFDDKVDITKEHNAKSTEGQSQPKGQSENINITFAPEMFCHLEMKEITKPECKEEPNVQNVLDKPTKEIQKTGGADNEETCTNISTPETIDSSEDLQSEHKAEEHKHIDQPGNQINENKASEEKQKCKVENNYSEIPLIDEEIIDDLGKREQENKEVCEGEKPDVGDIEESSFIRRDKASKKRREMNFSRAAGVWDSVVDNQNLQSVNTNEKATEFEDSDETTPTNTPKTQKAFVDNEGKQFEEGLKRPKFTPRLKAVKIKQEMFPLEGGHEDVKSVTDSLKESLKTLNSIKDKQENVHFNIEDSDQDDDDVLTESPSIEYQFGNKILYSPSLFGNYKNYQFHKHSHVGLQRANLSGDDSESYQVSRPHEELLSEITEQGEVGDGGSLINKEGQSKDSCLTPVKDKKIGVSHPAVTQRNVFNRSQSLPTTSLSNNTQHRIIYRNGHFVIQTNYEDEDEEETFIQEDEEDLSLESAEDVEQSKPSFHNGRSYSEANLTDKYHSPGSPLYDEDEDIDVFMRNENDVTVIENNNDGSSPNWHVLVKRRSKHEDQKGENRKSRPLSVDESQFQTQRVESDSEERSHTLKERKKRPSENVKRRSASFRELGTVKLQRNSSFRKAQERGYGYGHSIRGSCRNDSVGNLSLTPSEFSVCSDSGKSKGSGFFQKVFKKNKPTEKLTDPNKSKDSGARKMSLRGLFAKKNKGEFMSQRSIDELISPPIAVFQGDMDIHVDSAPNSPYSSQFRRRHTSAEIFDCKANSLPRKSTDYKKPLKLSNENNSSSRLLAVQNLDNHPKRPISPKPSNVILPRRNSNVSLPSSPIRDQYDGPFKTSTSKLDSSDSASICSGGSSILDASRYPPHVPENEMTPSNSNDSGIQRDASFHSSSESIKTQQDPTANVVRRRKSPSPRPERPKSEISVRWADLEETREVTPVKRRESSRRSKQRPKSDLEDNVQMFDEMYEEVIDDYDFLTCCGSSLGEEDMKPFGSQICLLPYSSLQNLEKYGHLYSYDQKPSMRRMSTPHPIKTRLERTPRKQRRRSPLVRSHSMPESLDKLNKKKKFLSTVASSNLHREDVLCHYDNDSSSDEGSEFSTDQISLHEKSLTSRLSSNYLSTLRERPEPDTLTYAEALWDHITMDPEELGFRAGDVIEVADMSDKDWWWGAIDDREGWFPATFVRLRVNQEHTDLSLHTEDILEHSSPENRRISVINSDQARENVVNEIINAEREYVKHLKDVVEGYIRHARKREDMFSEDRISVIFGNMEDIYEFSQRFLEKIEVSFVKENPHRSQLGHCFLECSKEFEIYSDYCNNHPSASEELKDLYKNKKYRHFFEACRLLQEMIEIPLEGFLLTPVQKICKYPLQLNELLKYTPVTHPDHVHIQGALEAMKKIATLINERKRKMESIEKLAYWQTTVEDWQGPDLLEDSSELIYAGEMNKVNSAGWSQERNFFLFDHQLVYCKKDLLKKNGYSYKGRIDLDDCEIVDAEDGKDAQYNVTVKNAWKIHEVSRDKWYLLVARSPADKEKWMKAFVTERKRVKEDQENNFVPLYWKRMVLNKIKASQEKQRTGGQMNYQKEFIRGMPSHATLPRSYSKKVQKKKGWFGFGNKKTK